MTLARRSAATIAALLLYLWAPWALAQDVTLTSRDGGLSISGSLQAFDGMFYRLDTSYGMLTVDAGGVTCDGPACPNLTAPKAILHITGDARAGEALVPALMSAFARTRGWQYEAGNPIVLRDAVTGATLAEVHFDAALSLAAKAALLSGRADLLLAATEEPDLVARELALDALVPIVSGDNPTPFITTTDLARALDGQISNWQAVGGPDRPMVLHGLEADSDLARALAARLGHDVAAVERHPDMASLAEAVARDPWALAVTGHAAAAPARALPLRDSCGFPLLPDAMAVKAGDYPLTLPVFAQIPRRHVGLVLRAFLDFLSTPAAEAAVAEAGYIDRSVQTRALTDDGLRLINAINGAGAETSLDDLKALTRTMDGASRVSMTFRFEGGSSTLDAHSLSALQDLAVMLEADIFKGNELILSGFSDGSCAANANRELAGARAQSVLDALVALTPGLPATRLPRIEALGEVLPIACDETGAGRRLNRRVELWLRPVVTDTPPSGN